MADLAVDDEDGGEVDEAEVVAACFSQRTRRRRNRLNQLWATSTTQRRGGWRSGWPGGGSGVAALVLGGMCAVWPRATASSRQVG